MASRQQQAPTRNEKEEIVFRTHWVMRELEKREQEITVFLGDIPFERFKLTVAHAIRNNPEIVIKASGDSVIHACIDSARDKLLPDGKEGAIVVFAGEAQWMPMTFGIRKKIVRASNLIHAWEGVIYANEKHTIQLGDDPRVMHEPSPKPDYENPIWVYSCAKMQNGHVSIEILTWADVLEIKKVAKKKHVWEAWPWEMAKKSAIRRHSKRLPADDSEEFVDMETVRMFPQFHTDNVDADGVIHDQRPRRQSQQDGDQQKGTPALEHTQTVPFDPAGWASRDDTDELVVAAKSEAREERQAARELPADHDWRAWGEDLEQEIKDATKVDEVNIIFARERANLDHPNCPDPDYFKGLLTDRIAALASGEDA